MSMNKKVFIEYDRVEHDRLGRKIHIWRQRTAYLTKEERLKAKENKETMKLKVS